MTLVADHVTGKTTTFKRRRWIDRVLGGQEGALEAGDFKVTQRAAGGANMSVDIAPGDAFVDIDSGTRSGRAHIDSDAIENRAVAASHATNPRIDYVVLDYNDTSIPAGSGGGDTPTLRVLTGTPTAAVTLDAPGASPPALPADALLLAAILVPAASASVTTANIRDRRKWARGAHAHLLNAPTINGVQQTVYAEVPTTWRQRVEVSGLYEVRYTLRAAIGYGGANDGAIRVQSLIDGAAPAAADGGGEIAFRSNSNNNVPLTAWQTKNVTAGSHLFSAQWRSDIATGVWFNPPVDIWVEEIVKPNANNN